MTLIVEDEPTNQITSRQRRDRGMGWEVGPGNYLAADMTRSGRPPMVALEIYSSGAGVRHLLLWHGDAHVHGAHLVATLPGTAGIAECKPSVNHHDKWRGSHHGSWRGTGDPMRGTSTGGAKASLVEPAAVEGTAYDYDDSGRRHRVPEAGPGEGSGPPNGGC